MTIVDSLRQRLDCNLSLPHRYMRTMQREHHRNKQWHVRAGAGQLEATRSSGPEHRGWTFIPVSAGFGVLRIACALPLGVVKGCTIGSQPITVDDWIYMPALTGRADVEGFLFAICEQGLTAPQRDEQLVLESSLMVQRADPLAGSLELRDLAYHDRCAILTLAASRALAPRSGFLWSDILHMSGVLDERREAPLEARMSSAAGEAEIRGVLGVASWPITVFTEEPFSRLLKPLRLKMSGIDEQGEALFALIVEAPPADGIEATPLFLLATDGVHRLQKFDTAS